MRVEQFKPPREIIGEVERIAERVSLDVGGIEYLVDDRDGRHYFYDINALSNFVADGRNVVGFDPFERLVDYLVERRDAGRGMRDAPATTKPMEMTGTPSASRIPHPASR
jgi:hypothetical protein